MNKREAYALGYDKGRSIARDAEFPHGTSLEEMESEAFDIEQNSRQYADDPTYDIESAARSSKNEWAAEEWFDAFDAGVAKGIRAGLKSRYGSSRARRNPVRRLVPRRRVRRARRRTR